MSDDSLKESNARSSSCSLSVEKIGEVSNINESSDSTTDTKITLCCKLVEVSSNLKDLFKIFDLDKVPSDSARYDKCLKINTIKGKIEKIDFDSERLCSQRLQILNYLKSLKN